MFVVFRLYQQVELVLPERRPEVVLPLAGNQRKEAEEVLPPSVMLVPRQERVLLVMERFPSLEVVELPERALVAWIRLTLQKGAPLHLWETTDPWCQIKIPIQVRFLNALETNDYISKFYGSYNQHTELFQKGK